MQVFDASAKPTTSYWQDGAAFPDWILGPPIPDWAPPKWVSDPEAARAKSSGAKVAHADRAKSDVEINWKPVLISGGLAVGSGALFGLAAGLHSGLNTAETTDDLTHVRTNTNLAATFGGLVGVATLGYVGVALFTDGSTAGLNVRW